LCRFYVFQYRFAKMPTRTENATTTNTTINATINVVTKPITLQA
jgi:hypothetical protein